MIMVEHRIEAGWRGLHVCRLQSPVNHHNAHDNVDGNDRLERVRQDAQSSVLDSHHSEDAQSGAGAGAEGWGRGGGGVCVAPSL